MTLMADIFVSYSQQDAQIAREVVRSLELQGWSVFWDRDIQPGHAFQRKISEELAAARCVVVLWSKISIESDWVWGEAQDGFDRGILVPVNLEVVRAPLPFRNLQTADLSDWPLAENRIEFQRVIQSIRQHVDHDDKKHAPDAATSEPIRNDPTISVRIARRVFETMHPDQDTGVDIEQLLTDAAYRLIDVQTNTPAGVVEPLLEGLHNCLACELSAWFTEGVARHACPNLAAITARPLLQKLAEQNQSSRLIAQADAAILDDPGNLTWFSVIASPKSAHKLVFTASTEASPIVHARLTKIERLLTMIT